jgi:hypothetical protein
MPLDPETLADAVIAVIQKALAPMQARLAQIDDRFKSVATETALELTRAMSPLRERLAVLETRAPVPGPPGADGLGFEDLALEQIDETTVTLKASRGELVKAIGSVTFPVVTFKRDYESGHGYTPGNLVRYKRAIWHCHSATALAPDTVTYDASGKPAGPQGKDCWTLVLSERK